MSPQLAVALLAVVLTALAQLLLKRGAMGWRGDGLWRLYLNPPTLAGYLLLLGVTLLNLYAYAVLPLKTFVFLQPLTYVVVAALSLGLLRERISRRQLAGYATILVGIALYYA